MITTTGSQGATTSKPENLAGSVATVLSKAPMPTSDAVTQTSWSRERPEISSRNGEYSAMTAWNFSATSSTGGTACDTGGMDWLLILPPGVSLVRTQKFCEKIKLRLLSWKRESWLFFMDSLTVRSTEQW